MTLMTCKQSGGSRVLRVHGELGQNRFPNEYPGHPVCNDADFKEGEIAGYLKDGTYFSGMKGKYFIVCSPGFIALTKPFSGGGRCPKI